MRSGEQNIPELEPGLVEGGVMIDEAYNATYPIVIEKTYMSRVAQHFDHETRMIFLKHYANSGLLMQSAKRTGISYETVNWNVKQDPVFKRACDAAKEIFKERIENAIHTRAIDGVEEDVYFQGEVVGTKRVYSDGLLQTLAKRHIPEYRDRVDIDATVTTAGVLVVQAAPTTADQWLDDVRSPQIVENTASNEKTPAND